MNDLLLLMQLIMQEIPSDEGFRNVLSMLIAIIAVIIANIIAISIAIMLASIIDLVIDLILATVTAVMLMNNIVSENILCLFYISACSFMLRFPLIHSFSFIPF